MSEPIPWVEKYRPKFFNDIVLSPLNRATLSNIVEKDRFPNLLFYGPPGTGKTTAIVNLVSMFQEKYNQKSKSLVIHLNASDERGIEVIRNQISQFVGSKTLFVSGTKFVILDEVDYMTKSAQQALRQLMVAHKKNVRFCLICNYASRIDDALQSDLVKLRFNQLPSSDIDRFLRNICDAENVEITQNNLVKVRQQFGSDMRSMINFLQSNIGVGNTSRIIVTSDWKKIIGNICDTNKSIADITESVLKLMSDSGYDGRRILSGILKYCFDKRRELLQSDYLISLGDVMHYERNMDERDMIGLVIGELAKHWRNTV